MGDDKTLDAAYALETPADNKELYARWASDYESNFVATGDYKLPERIVEGFVNNRVHNNILDIGAGTGIVGALLVQAGCRDIDGVDISPEMLTKAASKGCYRYLFEADLTQPLSNIPDNYYDALVSAGTFTNGHVGPDALDELLRIAKPDACFALSVNAIHWNSKRFDMKFKSLSKKIYEMQKSVVRVYGDNATGPHKDDICYLVQFRKR